MALLRPQAFPAAGEAVYTDRVSEEVQYHRAAVVSSDRVAVRPAPPASPQAVLDERHRDGTLKRAFDLIGASLILICAAPLFALIGIVIKLDSRGPIFFRQTRVGRGGALFSMFKFRKMPVDLPKQGPMLTRRSDPRLTKAGRWLERTKFDELPQLMNVVLGHMSLIGPRPEVPKFVDMKDPRWQVVLSVRPGLFGLSQNSGRNESSLYPEDCDDLEAFYREHILPGKLVTDSIYVRNSGVLYDIKLLIQGIMVSVFGTVTGSTLRSHGPQMGMLLADMVAALVSLEFAFFLTGGGRLRAPDSPGFWSLLATAGIARGVLFMVTGIYRRRPHSLTSTDLVRILQSVAYGSCLMIGVGILLRIEIPRAVLLLDALALSAIMIAKAYGVRQMLRAHRVHVPLAPWKAAAIVGGATLVDVFGLFLIIGSLAPAQLERTSPLRFAGLLLAVATMRLYGFFRYGLLPPPPGRYLFSDSFRILRSAAVASLMFYMSDTIFYTNLMTLPVLAAELAFAVFVTLGASRIAGTLSPGRPVQHLRAEAARRPRILLVGIGPEAEFFLSYIEHHPGEKPVVVGMLDTRPGDPRAQTINGVSVIGGLPQLGAILEAQTLDRVIYFQSAVTQKQRAELQEVCRKHDAAADAFPDLRALSRGSTPVIVSREIQA